MRLSLNGMKKELLLKSGCAGMKLIIFMVPAPGAGITLWNPQQVKFILVTAPGV